MGECHCVKSFLLENTPNKPLILVGLSGIGIGKQELVDKMLKKYPKYFQRAILHIAKEKQEEEEIKREKDYFVSKKEFDQLKSEGKLVEAKNINNERDGITIEELEKAKTLDKIMYLSINIDAAIQIFDLKIDANYIAIIPSQRYLNEKLKDINEKIDEDKNFSDTIKEEVKKIASAVFFEDKILNDNENEAFLELEETLKELYPDKFKNKIAD